MPHSTKRPWLLTAGTSDRVGRVQRQVRRAFVSSNGRPLTIGQLLPACYPRATTHPRWHNWNIRRALPKVAEPLWRIPGRSVMWGPKPELMKLIAPKSAR